MLDMRGINLGDLRVEIIDQPCEEIPEQLVLKMAHIMGPQSAHAKALKSAKAAKALGKSIAFYRHGNAIIVEEYENT